MDAEEDPASIERVQFSTDQEDETEDFINRTYVGNRTRFIGMVDDARFRVDSASGPDISADHIRSTVDYHAETEPFDYLVFLSVQGGRMHFTGAGEEHIVLAGEHFVFPVGIPLDISVHTIDFRLLRMPLEQLRKAAADYGLSDERLAFKSHKPASAAMARYWSAILGLANSTLLTDDVVGRHPLLIAGLRHTVATAALHTFPNSIVMGEQVSGPGAVGESALRRAIAFIEENAHRAITLSDIADAAGISPRGLQFAFARHRDTTPMQYLRLVRLTHAHRELQLADPSRGFTVEEIARRWGFASPSRFAAHYREAYGVPPHQTLLS
jgi:AraC-like DNA-binding protein